MFTKIDEVDQAVIRRVGHRIFGPDSRNKATVVVMGREDVGDWGSQLKKYGLGGAP